MKNRKLLAVVSSLILLGLIIILGSTLIERPAEAIITTEQLARITFDRQRMKLQVGSQNLTVEVVNSPASITQGLSGRSEIGADGMFFLFGEHRVPEFWMKEMKFDLDLIWISESKIVEITPNVPKPSPATPLADLPRYSPSTLVDSVLEVPAGKAAEWHLKPGDPVVITD